MRRRTAELSATTIASRNDIGSTLRAIVSGSDAPALTAVKMATSARMTQNTNVWRDSEISDPRAGRPAQRSCSPG